MSGLGRVGEEEQLDLEVGADVVAGDEVHARRRPESRSTAAMNRSSMAAWKALRLSWTIGARSSLDQRLLDVGVDAAEHAGQQVVAHQLGLAVPGGRW